jgi:hypothetical protein
VWAYGCRVSEDEIALANPIPTELRCDTPPSIEGHLSFTHR